MLGPWDIYAPATVRELEFNMSYVTSDVDGFNRTIIAISGLFPGPTVECNTGDTIRAKVRNELAEPTTLHWHGMYQRGTPWMDGVAGLVLFLRE